MHVFMHIRALNSVQEMRIVAMLYISIYIYSVLMYELYSYISGCSTIAL